MVLMAMTDAPSLEVRHRIRDRVFSPQNRVEQLEAFPYERILGWGNDLTPKQMSTLGLRMESTSQTAVRGVSEWQLLLRPVLVNTAKQPCRLYYQGQLLYFTALEKLVAGRQDGV